MGIYKARKVRQLNLASTLSRLVAIPVMLVILLL